MSFPDLYVLRHGETEWNVEGRLQGRLDSPLTLNGRAQARHQGALLKEIGATGLIYSSPQGRAKQTAQIIAESLAGMLLTDTALCEISMGQWDGELVSQVAPNDPEDTLLWKFAAPGGETLDAMKTRVRAFISQLTEPAVIVTHGVTSKILRGLVLGIEDEALAKLPGGQGVIFHLSGGQQRILS